MKKADIRFHSEGFGRGYKPAVNVKVHAWPFFTDEVLAEVNDSHDARFTVEWIEKHCPDEDGYWFNAGCKAARECLQQDAEEIFGKVHVEYQGRSGGWAVIHEFDDIDSWDAVMVAKWGKFCKWARQQADSVPYEVAGLIYLNVFQRWAETEDVESRDGTVAGDLPALVSC